MTEKRDDPVSNSRSKPGEIVDPPSNGEAVSYTMEDEFADFEALLIEWRGDSNTWITSTNFVNLGGQL